MQQLTANGMMFYIKVIKNNFIEININKREKQ